MLIIPNSLEKLSILTDPRSVCNLAHHVRVQYKGWISWSWIRCYKKKREKIPHWFPMQLNTVCCPLVRLSGSTPASAACSLRHCSMMSSLGDSCSLLTLSLPGSHFPLFYTSITTAWGMGIPHRLCPNSLSRSPPGTCPSRCQEPLHLAGTEQINHMSM